MNEQTSLLLSKYRDELTKMNVAARQVEDNCGMPGVRGIEDESLQLGHAQWMIYTMLEDAGDWSVTKIGRWLGFIQAILWTTKCRGIIELNDESSEFDG